MAKEEGRRDYPTEQTNTNKLGNTSPSSYPVTVDCSNVNLVWVHLLHFLLQLVLCSKGLVADVDVVFECEGELTVLKVILLH